MKLEVFEPAMCCSTGVCGESVDPALVTFADDLDWMSSAGVLVHRYNLAQEPVAFTDRREISTMLAESGDDVLPVVVAEDTIRSTGRYPSRTELATWAGIDYPTSPPAESVSTEIIVELAAIGAAVGANCEPCLKYHYKAARDLGLSNEQLTSAVRTAQMVKEAPAGKMVDLAAKLLHVGTSEIAPQAAPEANLAEVTPAASGGCCS
ncbi:MAG: arsenite efflux transporter metallochaperone ArsD [Dermatophilaceae bacterium]|nr:arsenite efflux transporter metallochaperone ArsD [Intrasporangiaceae bacterium]